VRREKEVVMIHVTEGTFQEVNWVVMPAGDGKFLVILTGILGLDFVGNNDFDYTRDTARLDMSPGGELNGLLATVLGFSGVDPAGGFLALTVDQWAQYAAINAFYHRDKPTHGFAVDVVHAINWDKNQINIGDTFGGLDIALAAMESDADLIRVGFQVTLLGRINSFRE
jgi:hypothetical protein